MEECKTLGYTLNLSKLKIISMFLSFGPETKRKLSIPFDIATSGYIRHKTATSLSPVFTRTLVYPFFLRFIIWRTILGLAPSLLH